MQYRNRSIVLYKLFFSFVYWYDSSYFQFVRHDSKRDRNFFKSNVSMAEDMNPYIVIADLIVLTSSISLEYKYYSQYFLAFYLIYVYCSLPSKMHIFLLFQFKKKY